MSNPIKLHSRSDNTTSVSGVSGTHTFDNDEVESFAEYISSTLSNDEDVKIRLPIIGEALFSAVRDGVILWYVINSMITKYMALVN